MKKTQQRDRIRLEAKRSTELWIYSFADMYMILAVFFIAIAVIYAAKAKHVSAPTAPPTAGRGPAAVTSTVSVDFSIGSDTISESAEENLKLLLPVLISSSGTIEVEGYADGTAVNTSNGKFSSNLALSNSRAVRVAEWLMRNGVAAKRVRTYSYGASHLFTTGEGGIPTNRRVVLKLLPAGGS